MTEWRWPVTVTVTGDDGEEVAASVLGEEPMDEEARAAVGEVVRAAQRRFRALFD